MEEYGLSTDALRAQHYPIWHSVIENGGLAADAFWELGISSQSGLDDNTIYPTDATINVTVLNHAIAMLAKVCDGIEVTNWRISCPHFLTCSPNIEWQQRYNDYYYYYRSDYYRHYCDH